MSIYIAGPMSGYPEMNFPAFNKAASTLRRKNCYETVINPVDINPDPEADWSDCMDKDLEALAECDVIYMLKGWEKSKGARIEYKVAKLLGINVIFESTKELEHV